jgi:small subunit ribosomal protein S17e
MGKVRPTLVKRTAREMLREFPEKFKHDFEHNKSVLEDLLVLPSKRMRNMVAGYITHLKRPGK